MINAEIPYGTALYDYLDQLGSCADARRREKLFAVSTAEEAEKHCAEVRNTLRNLMLSNRFTPGTTPPQVVATIEKNGVLIDKVLLEVRPGIFNAGLFWRRADIKGKVPGILGVCGHSDNGKACDSYQSFAFGLALKGFGVFMCDPAGQGESHQFKPAKGPTDEHTIMGKALRSAGLLTASLFIHDAQQALSYLISRPEIIEDKIGITGSSGGGQMSFFLFGLDDRIKAAGCSCHMNRFYDVFRNETATDGESTPEGLIAAGCDRPDFAIAGAPKPFLLMATEDDFLDLRSVKKSYEEVSHIYSKLGMSDRLHFSIAPGPHNYCRTSREAMYGFFTSLFLGKEDSKEPEFELLTDEEANVTSTGYVIDLPGALTEGEAIKQYLPDTYTATAESIADFLRKTLDLPGELPAAPDYRVPRNRFLVPGHSDNRFVLIPEPGTPVKSVLHTTIGLPLIPRRTAATLHCAHLSAADEMAKRAEEKNLFVLEVRGVGETRSTAGRSTRDDFFAPVGRDSFMEGTAELHGVPLLRGKIIDLLGAIALLKEHDCEELTLSGRGMGGVIAAFAAATVKLPVKEIILDEVPASLRKLIEKRIFRLPNSVLPKGMLQHFDFPELYECLKQNYTVTINCSEDVPADVE